MDQKEF